MLAAASQSDLNASVEAGTVAILAAATGVGEGTEAWWALPSAELRVLQEEKQRRLDAIFAEMKRTKQIVSAEMRERDVAEVEGLQAKIIALTDRREVRVKYHLGA